MGAITKKIPLLVVIVCARMTAIKDQKVKLSCMFNVFKNVRRNVQELNSSKKKTSSIDVPMKVEAETVETEKPLTNVVVPETPGTLMNEKKESDTTKATHDSITRAQALTLGEHALARKGRNSNETLTNAKEAEILETTHPSILN